MKQSLYQTELFLPSTVEGLNNCLDIIDDIKVKFGLNFDTCFRLHTVIVEAVENAFIHGNKGVIESKVRLFISITETEIFIEVEDTGPGFDLNSILSPVDRADLKSEGGRGIFFIKKLSSNCYTEGRGNILRIIINR